MRKSVFLLLFSALINGDRYSFEWTAGSIQYTCEDLAGDDWTRFGSRCVHFSDKLVPWFDAADVCKREYSSSVPLSEQNWLALRQIAPDNGVVWTGFQANSSSELLDNAVGTSIFNPSWSDNDPTRRPEGDCVAMNFSPLDQKSHGWTFKSCNVQLPVACETFACVGDEFRCADNSQCIPSAFVGDRVLDCKDGSDESTKIWNSDELMKRKASKLGTIRDDPLSSLRMQFIGITYKNEYFADPHAFDEFPGQFAQTYDPEVALIDLVNNFGSAVEPDLPSADDIPRCIKNLQAAMLFHNDISSVPRMAEFRNKARRFPGFTASTIIQSVIEHFTIPDVKNIDIDDDTCEFNRDQMEDKTLFYGTIYANTSSIGVDTFCLSNMNAYPNTVRNAEYKQAPQVELQSVLDSYSKWYNTDTKMMCHCFDDQNPNTTKIMVWFPLSATTTDTGPVSFKDIATVGFQHIIVPFGFSFDDSPVWNSLVPDRSQWLDDTSKDNYDIDDIIQDIWTITCRLAGRIECDQTAEPANPYVLTQPREDNDQHFLFILDVCGQNEVLLNLAQSVLTRYMPLLRTTDTIYLGTNDPAQPDFKIVSSEEALKMEMNQRRVEATCPAPDIAPVVSAFYREMNSQSIATSNVVHVTTVGNSQPAAFNDCASHPCSVDGYCDKGKCVCDRGFSGLRCTLFACNYDHDCMNGGTCDWVNGQKCVCSDGFDGLACQLTANDLCIGLCRNDGSCGKDSRGSPLCKCLDGWEGDRCDQRKKFPLLTDDLLVTDLKPIPSVVIFPAVEEFSLCGWVKPWSNAKSNSSIIVGILGEQSAIYLTTTGIEIRDRYAVSWNAGSQFPAYQWSQFCVVCDSKKCDFYCNGMIEYSMDIEGDTFYSATLANPYDVFMHPRISGYLSQIEVYSATLSANQVETLYRNCSGFVSSFPSEHKIVHWAQFLAAFPDGDKTSPGQCASKETEPSDFPPNAERQPPVATRCPGDQYIISQNRLTVVSWAEPEWNNPDGIVSVESNFRNGDVFYWGDFHIVYTARDSSGAVGRCEFDVFVAPNECSLPEYDSDQGKMTLLNTLSDGVGSYFAASVTCKDEKFPLPGPQFYTCDAMGQWHRSVAASTLSLPLCGATDDPVQEIGGQITFDSSENCTAVNNSVLDTIASVLGPEIVACVGNQTAVEGCYAVNITSCDELDINISGKVEFDVEEEATSLNFTVELRSSEANLNDDIHDALVADELQVTMVPTEFACASEYPIRINDGDLIICSQTTPGYYNNHGEMATCPTGEYSTDYNAEKCEKCPGNYTTMYDGATSEEDCYVSCKPGFYTSFSNRTLCIPCGIGSYEDEVGALERCKSCGGLSTLHEASNSQDDCVNKCNQAREELDADDNCRPCARGTFKNDPADQRCDGNCPLGLTTVGDGSTSLKDCTVLNCPKNRIATTDPSLPTPDPTVFDLNLYCPVCDRGFAQSLLNQTSCLPCNQFRDATDYPSCSSECVGTEDESCKEGLRCIEITGSPNYYKCALFDDKPNSSDASIPWWLFVAFAAGIVAAVVLTAIVVWCFVTRKVRKPAEAPVGDLDSPNRRQTMDAVAIVEDAEREASPLPAKRPALTVQTTGLEVQSPSSPQTATSPLPSGIETLLLPQQLADLPSAAFNVPSIPTSPVSAGGLNRESVLRQRMPTIPDADLDIPSVSSRSTSSLL